jgi:predicted O-methyltransferase YrrM
MKLVVYALCGNEEKMLPWFLRYYKSAGVDKIIVYLNSTSKDKSAAILQAEPLVEIRRYDTGSVLRDDIHRDMKSKIWKQDVWEEDDWAIVVDCDEFVLGNPMALKDALCLLAKEGVTVPQVHGYNLIGDAHVPCSKNAGQIYDAVPFGISTDASGAQTFGSNNYAHGPYHKPCVFRPAFIEDMKYDAGCHHAKPVGKVNRGKDLRLWLLHAKWAFGADYVLQRPFNLSEENKKHKWGISFLDASFIRGYHSWAKEHAESLFRRLVAEPGREYPVFTEDWFSNRIPQWHEWFAPFKGLPVKGMEIGVFEGQSSLWLLENVLTHYDSRLFAIDTFEGGDDQVKANLNLTGLKDRYTRNISKYKDRVRIFHESSITALPKLTGNFDFIYVDGSHLAPDVLIDTIQSWQLLRVGGRLIWDDYAWRQDPVPQNCPYPAIDAFLFCFQDRYKRLPSNLLPMATLQAAVEKTHE